MGAEAVRDCGDYNAWLIITPLQHYSATSNGHHQQQQQRQSFGGQQVQPQQQLVHPSSFSQPPPQLLQSGGPYPIMTGQQQLLQPGYGNGGAGGGHPYGHMANGYGHNMSVPPPPPPPPMATTGDDREDGEVF